MADLKAEVKDQRAVVSSQTAATRGRKSDVGQDRARPGESLTADLRPLTTAEALSRALQLGKGSCFLLLPDGTVRLVTASGVIEAPLVILDEVDVGGAIARYVPAVIHDLPGMPPNVVGLLGMSFLERFQVNLDLTSGSLTLQSGK